jgi:hypothetical protein
MNKENILLIVLKKDGNMKEYVQIGKYTYGIQDSNVVLLLPYMCNNDIDIFFKKYYDLIESIE